MSLGTGWGSATFMLFATFVVEAEAWTQMILLGYFGANVIALPIWIKLATKLGKKNTWVTGGILFVLVTPSFLLLGPGDLGGFFICLALYGIAGGSFGALSMSMKADVIEIAARRSSENISGAYIAVWSLGQKLVAALALGLALPTLELFGFNPAAENSESAINALAYIYVLPPWLFYALGVVVILRYPITSIRLEKLRLAFDKKDQRNRKFLKKS